MLPKIWKKVLLAICIVACIYNIMSKLVNRNSLEINLKSVDDGTTVFNLFQKEESNIEKQEQTQNTIESPVKEETVEQTSDTTDLEEAEEKETKNNKATEFIVLY